MFSASCRMNLEEGKGLNKVGVCDWLPLYYHAGMYRVPFCYIAVNCDRERLGYLRNLGYDKQEPDISWRVQCYLGLIFLAQFFVPRIYSCCADEFIDSLGGGLRRGNGRIAAFQA